MHLKSIMNRAKGDDAALNIEKNSRMTSRIFFWQSVRLVGIIEVNNTASPWRDDDFSFKYLDDILSYFLVAEYSVLMYISVGDSEKDWI